MTHHHGGHHPLGSILEVSFRNCHDASEYADLEGNLGRVPGVTSVHLDRTRGVAHLRYDPGTVTPEELERRLHAAGYACDCEDERPRPPPSQVTPRSGTNTTAETWWCRGTQAMPYTPPSTTHTRGTGPRPAPTSQGTALTPRWDMTNMRGTAPRW